MPRLEALLTENDRGGPESVPPSPVAGIARYRRRTLTRDLIISLTLAVSLTVTIHIAIYFLYSSRIAQRELEIKAESIATELADVLTISLWNLSRNTIYQISKAYLKSDYLTGIQVNDDQDHQMFAEIPADKRQMITKVKRISWEGTQVGTVQLWFTGRDTQREQHAMIRGMLFIGLSVTLIVIIVTHFIMKYLLNRPIDSLIRGIRTIAGGDYQSPMPAVPQDDINAIIKEANQMANQIALRNEQLKKEILERTRAEDELKNLNQTLKLRIGQLTETEKALAESEKKYRGIFENALEGIFQTSPEGRFIDANPSMAHILGYDTPEELISSVSTSVKKHYVNPRQRDEYLELLQVEDSIANYECQFYRKDGRVIWGVLQARAFRDAEGRLTHLEGLMQDITERKQTEMELRVSEKKYRQLYEGSRDGYVMTDIRGRFIECNSSFSEMLGYSWSELENLTYSMITTPKWRHWEQELMEKQTIKRGYTDVYEKEYVKKDGTIFPVEIRAYLIQDGGRRPVGFWAFVRDITERKSLQVEAMRNARLASLGEMAAGVAHEINNPINGIINYAQILINRSKQNENETEIPRRIIKEGERIERIVGGLLSFARERKERKYAVDLRGIFSETMDFTGSMLRKDHVQIDLNLADNLPLIKANPQQLQQVFLNIISNARFALNRKYSGAHADKRLAITGALADGEQYPKVQLAFFDKGTGIASNIIDRICDPFFSTKPANQGTGLGLSISDGIIKDHNGKLWAESIEGEFTKMIVELPI